MASFDDTSIMRDAIWTTWSALGDSTSTDSVDMNSVDGIVL